MNEWVVIDRSGALLCLDHGESTSQSACWKLQADDEMDVRGFRLNGCVL